jgi:hypothetical protein
VDRLPNGELEFRCPDGRPLPEFLLPPKVPHNPVGVLRARNESEGLRLDTQTLTPSWLGEPLNVGYAISVMHPLAR